MRLIIKTGLHGRGVFAGEPIAKGSVITPFTGPFLRQAQTTPETYALQIGADLYIGASGGFDDFINHSCQPNAGMIIKGATATLIAIEDIAVDQEVFFDYSTTMNEDDWQMTCHCGTPACRQVIRDGKHLPEPVWQRYAALGIVPDYVIEARNRL